MRDNNKRIQDNPESCIVHRASRITSAISRYFSLLTSHFSLRKGGSSPVFIFLSMLVLFSEPSYAKEISFTQDDRDRLVRLETKVEALDKRIDDVNSGLNKRIDDFRIEIKSEIQVVRDLIYVVIAGMIALIGFVIWDRRTALAPAIRKNRELEEREEKLERALKEYAMEEPRLKEILKHLGLL